MDTSGLVIPRETLMHRHPREWLDVCLSSSSLNDRPPREKASSRSRTCIRPPFSKWSWPTASIQKRGEYALCREQVVTLREKEAKGEEREKGQGVE